MNYTYEEFTWILAQFTEGCRFLYEGTEGATIHLGKSRRIHSDTERVRAQFDNPEYDQEWTEFGMTNYYHTISNCTWPDGSPMIPFVEYDGTPYNPVLSKIKSLDMRFKAKALPKTKQKALPLPA